MSLLDMVSVTFEGKDFVVISHSMLPLMTIDKAEIEDHNESVPLERHFDIR